MAIWNLDLIIITLCDVFVMLDFMSSRILPLKLNIQIETHASCRWKGHIFHARNKRTA